LTASTDGSACTGDLSDSTSCENPACGDNPDSTVDNNALNADAGGVPVWAWIVIAVVAIIVIVVIMVIVVIVSKKAAANRALDFY